MPDPASPDLHVRDLAVRRGGAVVVAGASFVVGAGEVVAVIGPNGAGKTTMLEAIVGLRRRERGVVRFGDRSVDTLQESARLFSFMPDEVTPPLEASVETLVAHAAACAGAATATHDALLDGLGLRPFLSARATELSRGERKRLALFGALRAGRPIAVLDEPFGAFDPLQLREILAVVHARAAEGTSMLISVHQMTEAERVADRVILLARGRAVAVGSLEDLRKQYDAPRATLEDLFLRALEGSRAAP